jgi:hypothetical protein
MPAGSSRKNSPEDVATTHPLVAASVVAAVALAVGLFRLGEPSLWFDEAYSWYIVSSDWSHFWHEVCHANDCGGFVYSSILKHWTMIFGLSEWAFRLPSVLYAVAMALVLLQIGREISGLRAGLFMACFGICHPETIVWSRQARAYSLEMLLTAVFVLCLIRYVRTYDRRQGAWLALAGSALSLTHIFGVFVVAGAGLYLLGRLLLPRSDGETTTTKRWLAVWPMLAPLPFLACWAVMLRSCIHSNLNSFWIRDSLEASYRDLGRSFSLLALCMAICFVVGGVRVLRRRASADELNLWAGCGCLALCILAGPLAVSLLSRGGHHFILARYHFPLLVVMFVIVGYYAARLPLLPTIVAAIAIVIFGWIDRKSTHAYDHLAYDGSDTRAAVAYLANHRWPDDTVLVVPSDERITALYYGLSGPTIRTAGLYEKAEEIGAAVRADPPPQPGTRKWVLLYRRRPDEDLTDFGFGDAKQTAFGSLRLVQIDPEPVFVPQTDDASASSQQR